MSRQRCWLCSCPRLYDFTLADALLFILARLQARSYCQSLGADLAVFSSARQYDTVMTGIQGSVVRDLQADSSIAWIGIRRGSGSSNAFVTAASGRPATFTRWAVGSPGGSGSGSCVAVRTRCSTGGGGNCTSEYVTLGCDGAAGSAPADAFICERATDASGRRRRRCATGTAGFDAFSSTTYHLITSMHD